MRKSCGELESGEEPKTLKEVGAELGVSKERIRQFQARAVNKLVGRRAKKEFNF